MATWNIWKHEQQLRLKYVAGGVAQECGQGPAQGGMVRDLVAWVSETATPWDVIAVEDGGTFVRMHSPRTTA